MPKISIIIPIHDMKNGAFFLWRAVNSIMAQTFKDYEIIVTKEGSMPVNTNAGIKKAKGDLIKILYMDDWFAHSNSLKEIVDAMEFHSQYVSDERKFAQKWLITGSSTNLKPCWTEDIHSGNNKLGSPSSLTMRRRFALLFDENMSWLLDCDLYRRLYDTYGKPIILEGANVNIGIHDGQATNLMSDDYKLSEHEYMQKKYA